MIANTIHNIASDIVLLLTQLPPSVFLAVLAATVMGLYQGSLYLLRSIYSSRKFIATSASLLLLAGAITLLHTPKMEQKLPQASAFANWLETGTERFQLKLRTTAKRNRLIETHSNCRQHKRLATPAPTNHYSHL